MWTYLTYYKKRVEARANSDVDIKTLYILFLTTRKSKPGALCVEGVKSMNEDNEKIQQQKSSK